MGVVEWLLLASVGLIVLGIIVPKPSQRNRVQRIEYLLDRAARRQAAARLLDEDEFPNTLA